MATLPIVEHLDELKDCGPCLGWTLVVGVVDELGLQRSKEALHDGVVPAVGAPAHRAFDAVGSRRLTLANTADAIVRGAAVTGAVMIILLFIFVMTRAMVLEQIPNQIALWLTSISDNKLVLMLLINVILLLIGMVVDDASGSILAAIVLLPVANQIGIHPIHFAAIVGVNIAAGNITPPCAPLLYLAGAVGKASLIEMLGPTLKFLLIGYVPVILLVTYVPDLALFLPRLLLGIG